jgi:SAM-dependent methyltransferase
MRARPKFTAHDIELPDGTQTLPGAPLIGAEPTSDSYLRTLRLFCPPPARVADLGCLEGGDAVHFARAGYDVVAIEGQQRNFAVCEWVADRVELPNLRFVLDDVRNIRAYGSFDAVLCAGLLYHLDRPASFLHALGEVTRRLLIINTNYATESGREVGLHPLTEELVEHEGKLGRWYEEGSGAWFAVENERSFWLERRHLLQALIEAGFPSVFEQFDWLGDVVADRTIEDRLISCFVAVRPPPLDGEHLSHRVQALEADVERMRTSVSWRVTAPLRSAGTWLRRVRGR